MSKNSAMHTHTHAHARVQSPKALQGSKESFQEKEVKDSTWRAGLPEPQLRERVPRIITFQRKRANRRIANEEMLIKMLRQYGDVSRDARPPMPSHPACALSEPLGMDRQNSKKICRRASH